MRASVRKALLVAMAAALVLTVQACGGGGEGGLPPTLPTDTGNGSDTGSPPQDSTVPDTKEDTTDPDDTKEPDTKVEPDADTTGPPDDTDSVDTDVPPVECPDCPMGLCDWCELGQTTCNPLDPDVCINAGKALVAGGTIPTKDGAPLYPDCSQPTCSDQGACTLEPLAHCCTVTADCATPQGGCFFTDCPIEVSPPEHLTNNPPHYCQYQILENCCAGESNTVVVSETFAVSAGLPSGWSLSDSNPADGVNWHIRSGEDKCFSGDHCIHLGRKTSTEPDAQYCYTYYNGDLNDCVPDETPGATPPTAISVNLTTPQLKLEPAGQPWVMTFRLRMNTEAPVPGTLLSGDNLVVRVVSENSSETVVFDSSSMGNTTNGKWRLVAVDLSAWHGQPVFLTWGVDTKDGQSNYEGPVNGVYEGVFLDDIQISTTCNVENKSCTSATSSTCQTSNPCAVAQCAIFEPKTALSSEAEAGFCYFPTVEGCQACNDETDCIAPPETGGLYEAACKAGKCEYSAVDCQGESLVVESFEAGLPAGWKAVDDPTCSDFWTTSAGRSTDGANSLYFGQVAKACGTESYTCSGQADPTICPTYDCGGLPVEGSIETGVLALPPQTTLLLSFDLFLSTEFDAAGPEYFNSIFAQCENNDAWCADRLELFVNYDDGISTQQAKVWDSYAIQGTTKCGWAPVNVNLSTFSGNDVQLQWVFDTQDSTFNGYEGVYIDNLKLDKLCNEPCTNAGDCTVVGACTTASCVQGECKYDQAEGCCATDIDCDDTNPCTADQCLNGSCTQTITSDVACCSDGAVYWTQAFEGSELPADWVVVPTENTNVIWQWTQDLGKGGGAGLYFGDLANMTYEQGVQKVAGAIDTPAFQVPPGGDPIVRFDLYLSTEFDDYSDKDYTDYKATNDIFVVDRLVAYVSKDGGKNFEPTPVWRSEDSDPIKGTTKNADGNLTWMQVALSLKQVAGEGDVVVRFEFDSFEGSFNNYGGVYIDNMELAQVCPGPSNPDPCYADAFCDDNDVCTIDACENSQCVSEDAVGNPQCCFPSPLTTYGFESGNSIGWTIDGNNGPAKWQVSKVNSGTGTYSMHFGNLTDGTYSGCTCGSADACDADCPQSQCTVPSGTVTSPEFTVAPGKDYELSFAMLADLSLVEGPFGFSESFTIKLITETPAGSADLAMLVCHANECADVMQDPCKSGVNFAYPGCGGDPTVLKGDYHKWIQRTFKLSDLLCGLKGDSVAGTFINSLQSGGVAQTFRIQVSFAANDNFGNCGSGLYFDDIVMSELCTDWNTCQ